LWIKSKGVRIRKDLKVKLLRRRRRRRRRRTGIKGLKV
jgi:hypothetical protein